MKIKTKYRIGVVKMSEWTYEVNVNNDIWIGDIVNSKQEATEKGMKEAKDEGYTEFKIGIVESAEHLEIDVDRVIEDIQEYYYDQYGEVAEYYLDDITKEDKKELKEIMNNTFWKWIKEKGYEPLFYKVTNEEIIKINE